MKLITEDLIESIKNRAFVPVSQQTFDTTRILSLVNQEFSTKLLPVVHSIREDFFLTKERRSVSANVSYYSVPERASGDSLKAAILLDLSGNKLCTLAKSQIQLVSDLVSTGTPSRLIVAGPQVILNPVPSANLLMDLWYFERPSDLVATSSCAKITAISSGGGTTTFTVDTDQTANWTTSTVLDFLSSKSPFRLSAKDVAISAVTSTTIAVSTASVTGESGAVAPVVGDYLCVAQTCNYPMVPVELHPVLAQLCAVRILRSMGDMNKTKDAESELSNMLQATIKLITNRVEATPDVIVNACSFLTAQSGIGAGSVWRFGG